MLISPYLERLFIYIGWGNLIRKLGAFHMRSPGVIYAQLIDFETYCRVRNEVPTVVERRA